MIKAATDTTPPETAIDAGPAEGSTTGSTDASFAFSADEAASFECDLDGGGFVPCASPAAYAGLAHGSHAFSVRATDLAGNEDPTPAVRNWIVDTSVPETSVDGAPPDPDSDATPTFAFSSTDGTATFECDMDGVGYAACASPFTYPPLADGAHLFSVRAVDPAGNEDPSPATHAWTVDTSLPETTIDSGPADGSTTGATGAVFAFSSPDAGAAFECDLDGGGFVACTSPEAYAGLADGPHAFAVRAKDAVGNLDPSPATRGWTVDTAPPDTAVDTGPPDPDSDTTPTFTFSSVDGVAFECDVDGTGFDPCASPRTYPALLDGPHVFSVRSTDLAGNVDPSPATHAWTIDTDPPETSLDSGPAQGSSTYDDSPSFTFSADEAGTFECKMDGGLFTACSSPESYAGLAPGPHVFEVRAVDAAGNLDATAPFRTWTVVADDHTDVCAGSTAVGLQSATPGVLELAGDTDAFSVSLPSAAATYRIFSTGAIDTYGELRDAGCAVVETDDDSGFGGNFEILHTGAAGTFHVLVTHAEGLAGPYSLEVRAPWITETVDAPGDTGKMPSMAIAADGTLHVAYLDESTDDLRHAWHPPAGFWNFETVDSAGSTGEDPSLAIASDGTLHVAYRYDSSDDLRHAWGSPGSWTVETVDAAGNTGYEPSLAIAADDTLHVAYHDEGTDDLRHAWGTPGSWSTETVDAAGQTGEEADIAIAGDGTLHVAYRDDSLDDLRHAWGSPGSWSTETVEATGGTGYDPSIAIAEDDTLHVVFFEDSGDNLRHVWGTAGSWSSEEIDGTDDVGERPSLAIGPDGRLHVAYFKDSGDDLRHAWGSPGSWNLETVDSAGNTGRDPSLAIAADGTVHVAYRDESSDELRHAQDL